MKSHKPAAALGDPPFTQAKTLARQRLVMKLAKQGLSGSAIARYFEPPRTDKPSAAFGLAPFTAAQTLARRRLVRKLSAQGMSGSDIARYFEPEISRQRVQQLRDAENVPRLEKPHLARQRDIPALIEQGLCAAEMARHFGVKADCVYADLRKMPLTAKQRAHMAANTSLAMSEAKKAAHLARLAKDRKGRKKSKA